MSEDKLYPPSDLKLKRLREAGVIPFSRELLSAGVIIGLSAALPAFVFYQGGRVLKFAVDSFSGRAAPEAFAADFWALSIAILWPVLVLVLLIGALQSRFLFTPKVLGINFQRLFSSPNIFAGFGTRIGGGVSAAFKAACILALGIVLIYRFFLEQLADIRIAREASRAADTLFQRGAASVDQVELLRASVLGMSPMLSLLFGLAGGALFIGIVSWLTSLVMFRLAHGMTRAELEAEYREMEVSPEIRQARKEHFLS